MKAATVTAIRRKLGLAKCREANDYHHAHDAYLAGEVGRFMLTVHPDWLDNPCKMAKAMKKRREEMSEQLRGADETKMAALCGTEFLVDNFLRTHRNEAGEVIWDPEAERERIVRHLNIAESLSLFSEQYSATDMSESSHCSHLSRQTLRLDLSASDMGTSIL